MCHHWTTPARVTGGEPRKRENNPDDESLLSLLEADAGWQGKTRQDIFQTIKNEY